MTATRGDIEQWLTVVQAENRWKGKKDRKVAYVLIVCDTFDYSDYHVCVYDDEDIHERVNYYNDYQKMSQVMEIYDMKKDIGDQMSQGRAWSLPPHNHSSPGTVTFEDFIPIVPPIYHSHQEIKAEQKKVPTSKPSKPSKASKPSKSTKPTKAKEPKVIRRSSRKRTPTDRYKPY